ncbi:uncharacterized protein RSE6_09795 [Rhynchosporium secalis]|uniref:MINDY deubiquitinase domain-containing protein n=1 Tax=Rhynchosporium secalis TaxID=38038 RepID=A0A1E1MIV8_RHYSE|nr:uncharacterized protein RSE6_09795 [Rhynchosporium secalis]
MVSRKPVPSADSSLAPSKIPPYPVTPISANEPLPFRRGDSRSQTQSDSPSESENTWGGEADNQKAAMGLPESLRVGPPGYTPKTSQEMFRPGASSTNPYLKKEATGFSNGNGNESSAEVWGASEERPGQQAAQTTVPTQQLEQLSVSEQSTNPWQPALDGKDAATKPLPSIAREDSGNQAWAANPPAGVAPTVSSVDTSQPVLVDIDEPESPAWDEDEPSPVLHEMPVDNSKVAQQFKEDGHVWDEQGDPSRQHPVTAPLKPESSQQGEGWNVVDHEPTSFGAQESGTIGGDGHIVDRNVEEQAPALPPRRSEEHPPPQPPRPLTTANTGQSSTSLSSPAAHKQKAETYEIKVISWYDVNAAQNPRVSPILVQNANGPCPLLALVNALTLSTPAGVETALIETLRSREQVSLGLLLDAVLDELMSGRRGDAAQGLPDVGDLYKFLLTLHTGMNVNPRFLPNPPAKSVNDPRNSMSHVHPSAREQVLPGSFEDTREMKLYSTFSIPLIHGWLPGPDSAAFDALKRSANSYEDAQNLMFEEADLESKLSREGLSFEEQGRLEDIATIRAFFTSNATQLTSNGLATITISIPPGGVAILFRNDHFSTLYRHPATLQLLQLVTDMGYAGHQEVVWESLIDVNGGHAEFFSGDFRLVGGASQTPPTSSNQNDGWTTVTNGRHNQSQQQHQNQDNSQNRANSSSPPYQFQSEPPSQSPSNIEQEDHDLALALQLQEEEEERERIEFARRRRETQLSQQYIEQQGQQQTISGNNPNNDGNIHVMQRGGGGFRGNTGRGRGNTSLRGRGSANATEARPTVPPRDNTNNANAGATTGQSNPADPDAGIDAPPPSYEHASTQAAYDPPVEHPSHPSSDPFGRRTSAFPESTGGAQQGGGQRGRGGAASTGPRGRGGAGQRGGYPGRGGRGAGGMVPGQVQPDGRGREDKCAVM